ncbi:MAG: hypothetical protein DRI90_13265 [Deltaproteobacteria bacterium]|nr:MAG: hypothetical protein DRI90_13265 [Deltaproteobacteria bacterium]
MPSRSQISGWAKSTGPLMVHHVEGEVVEVATWLGPLTGVWGEQVSFPPVTQIHTWRLEVRLVACSKISKRISQVPS